MDPISGEARFCSRRTGEFLMPNPKPKTDNSNRPLVRSVVVELPRPSLQDNSADLDRLLKALAGLGFDTVRVKPATIGRLVRKIRDFDFQLSAVLGCMQHEWEILDLLPRGSTSPLLAFAIDLGSSCLAFRLLDLATGKTIAETSAPNPQTSVGEDILTRILYARTPDGLGTLRGMVANACADAMQRTLEAAGFSPESVYAVACAGNTAMTHFFWGLDPSGICREPYIPSANTFPLCRAEEVGLDIFPNAILYTFPNVGSYVGGDIVAGILAAGLHKRTAPGMLVDVGTNAEVVLGNSDWLLACAGAAGPALEGGVFERGMQACAGAIDRVRIDGKTLEPSWTVIGGKKPRGVCGSGLIDLVAEMFASGILTVQGRFNRAKKSPRFRQTPDGIAYALALASESADNLEILVSELDIGVFLKSKAAMYTILSVITAKVGLKFEDIDNIFIAGNFGNRIDPEMAVRIGMIPDLPPGRFCGIGNSSLLGSSMLLLDRALLKEADEVRRKITYIELNVNMELMNEFRGALFLPHTNRRLFPSVRIQDVRKHPAGV